MEVDPTDISRFEIAQHLTHADALAEISAGRKRSHWMWWEFPQLRGLGRSDRAMIFGIADLEEARVFLAHPVLRARLVELAEAMLTHAGTPPEQILSKIDAAKMKSCATLFAAVPDAPDVFRRLLDAFYGGQKCPSTVERLDA